MLFVCLFVCCLCFHKIFSFNANNLKVKNVVVEEEEKLHKLFNQ